MATITTITHLSSLFLREQPVSSKLNSEFRDKVNILIDNNNTINTVLEETLAGSISGASQAKIAFGLPAAPTGWTRDTSFSSDFLIRITDGVTLPPTPPGSNPTVVGGEQGGQDFNFIVGLDTNFIGDHNHTLANHTHSLNNHVHNLIDHFHSGTAHTHSMADHHANHTVNPFTQTLSTEPAIGPHPNAQFAAEFISAAPHTHFPAAHGHQLTDTVGGTSGPGAGTGPTSALPGSSGSGSDITNGPSTNTSGNGGTHNHSIANDGTWRPRYLNILLCKKD